MPQHDAFHRKRHAITIETLQHDTVVRGPLHQLVCARSRLVRLEPLVAEIVTLRMRFEQLLSSTEAGHEPSTFNTNVGAYFWSVVIETVLSSIFFTFCSAFSFVSPIPASTAAAPLSSNAVRWIDHATSSAVSGLPEWNLRPERILKVNVRPSGLTAHDCARSPLKRAGSFRSTRIRRS